MFSTLEDVQYIRVCSVHRNDTACSTLNSGAEQVYSLAETASQVAFLVLSETLSGTLFYAPWFSVNTTLRRISCHGRNHSQASCEYSLTIFLCCLHHSEYSLLGSKFSTNLLFAASKCHVTMQQRGSSRCSKWPNRMGSLQW